ncbi:hypothetical protein M3J09_004888 [Ascochyta lentis]
MSASLGVSATAGLASSCQQQCVEGDVWCDNTACVAI